MTLGNVKPDSLQQVEKALWRVLIQIVQGGVELETAIDGFLTEFPESFVQAVDAVECGWFSASLGNYMGFCFCVMDPRTHERWLQKKTVDHRQMMKPARVLLLETAKVHPPRRTLSLFVAPHPTKSLCRKIET